jgi:hypothetical protein
MKKSIIIILAFISIIGIFNSCVPEEDVFFEESLLIGKWVSGTEFYNYNSDYTGYTWDTSDDVTEDEAQNFEWSLINEELTHIHIMEIGGSVPKVYKVIELTTNSLIYEDNFGTQSIFSKINE